MQRMESDAHKDRPQAVEKRLPAQPMTTPNRQVIRTILMQRRRYLPQLLQVLEHAEVPRARSATTAKTQSPSRRYISPYRLSWVIHLLAAWADNESFLPMLRHLQSPLPYAQEDATWAISLLSPSRTVKTLLASSLNIGKTTRMERYAVRRTLGRMVARCQKKSLECEEDRQAAEQAKASLELILHRSQRESPEEVAEVAAMLLALKCESARKRVRVLHEQGYFDELSDIDIYDLYAYYDGRREHIILKDPLTSWVIEDVGHKPGNEAQKISE